MVLKLHFLSYSLAKCSVFAVEDGMVRGLARLFFLRDDLERPRILILMLAWSLSAVDGISFWSMVS